MNNIVFYYKNGSVSDDLVHRTKNKYPFAKVVKTSDSIVNIVKSNLTDETKFTWFIDLELSNWETYLNYEVNHWDSSYVHIFESRHGSIYLVPALLKIKDTDTEFVDKKIINAISIRCSNYDAFFISYDEPSHFRNLNFLLQKRPDAIHISNVKGIFNAHLEAAKKSTTEFFWVVDADATIIDAFDFDYRVPEWDFDVVHIWKSINPINFLEYGYGGVKLIPKHLLLNADETTAVDVTTSIGAKIKVMDDISNINNFAISPLNAWRSAFRECAKLASAVIPRQNQEETDYRLNVWVNKGGDRPLGEYVKGGASAGKWYGETYKGNKEMLARINDYEWLAHEFEAHIKMFPPETFKD